MGSGLSWTTDNKRCRCKKCDTYQLVEWFKIFNNEAKCKHCGEPITANDYIILKRYQMPCNGCERIIDKRKAYTGGFCHECFNKREGKQ